MLAGGCLCGAVRYEIDGAPIGMYHCHCGTCRKANGAAFATNLIVPSQHFAIVAGADAVASFESSPHKRRHFCGRCGSPLYSAAEATPTIVSLRCGTLDGDPGLRPTAHFHTASKAPWFEICDDLRQLPQGAG